MEEYRTLLSTLNNTALLNKALSLGQISTIQYFQDESYYFSTYDKYLQMEWEHQQAVARLYKYQVCKKIKASNSVAFNGNASA